jgi:hypothetical protein
MGRNNPRQNGWAGGAEEIATMFNRECRKISGLSYSIAIACVLEHTNQSNRFVPVCS